VLCLQLMLPSFDQLLGPVASSVTRRQVSGGGGGCRSGVIRTSGGQFIKIKNIK